MKIVVTGDELGSCPKLCETHHSNDCLVHSDASFHEVHRTHLRPPTEVRGLGIVDRSFTRRRVAPDKFECLSSASGMAMEENYQPSLATINHH